MMPQMPPVPQSAQSDPGANPMPCPHCGQPVNLQKAPPMGAGPSPKPAGKKSPMPPAKDGKPAPKKNAANAPMDELKEVLKAGVKPNGND